MAARFCPECGQEIPSTARFCPNCAARLDGAAPTGGFPPLAGAAPPRVPRPPLGSPAGVDAAASKSRRLLIPGMIAALVVLAISVAVLAAQSRRQSNMLVSAAPAPTPALTNAPTGPPGAGPALTNAPTAPPGAAPALTNAPAAPPVRSPGLTNAPTAPGPSLPPDVAAYLNFLQQIEQRRVAMNNDTAGATAMLAAAQGMGGLGGGGGMPDITNDPEGEHEASDQAAKEAAAKQNTQRISQGYTEYALKWQGLVRDFRAMPPPAACAPLAGRYLTFLGDYTTVISKMQVALLNHDSSGLPDLSAVAQVQGQVNTDGGAADAELGSLCGRYGVPKPFIISPDGGAPSLLGH